MALKMTDEEIKNQCLPCPFCGKRDEMVIHYNHYWSGMRYIDLSVEIRHWCEREGDMLSPRMISRIGKTIEEAIKAWNKRENCQLNK